MKSNIFQEWELQRNETHLLATASIYLIYFTGVVYRTYSFRKVMKKLMLNEQDHFWSTAQAKKGLSYLIF